MHVPQCLMKSLQVNVEEKCSGRVVGTVFTY